MARLHWRGLYTKMPAILPSLLTLAIRIISISCHTAQGGQGKVRPCSANPHQPQKIFPDRALDEQCINEALKSVR
jgi:hypothetical protein